MDQRTIVPSAVPTSYFTPPPRNAAIPMAATTFGIYFILTELYYVVFRESSSSFLDETLALILAIPALLAILAFKRLQRALALFLLYVAVTVVGNILYKYGGVNQPAAGLLDMALDLKPFLIEGGFVYMFWRSRDAQREMDRICWIIIGITLLNSLFVIYDLRAGNVGFMGRPLEMRNGIYQPMGFQVHKARSAALTMLGAIFAFYFAIYRRSIIIGLVGAYFAALVFLHQSAKELAAFILVLPFFLPGRRIQGLRPILLIGSVAVLALLVVASPVGSFFLDRVDYFTGASSTDKARTLLVMRGYDIAVDHAPFGTGAGTFGSAPSFQMGYSGVYYSYGLAKIWGASPDHPNFLQDAFWGKIMGQSGFLGAAVYLAFLATAFGACFRLDRFVANTSAVPACAACILALLISTASSPFSDDFVGIVLAVFSAYAVSRIAAANQTPAPDPDPGPLN